MQQAINSRSTPENVPTDSVANLEITTFSYEERRMILPAVTEAMEHCGCWLLERRPVSFTQMEYRFELHAFAIVDLYAALIAAGLELTRASHDDLTIHCAVRMHDVRPSVLPRLLTIRLLVNFLEDIHVSDSPMSLAATA